ncbi:unnamed protein product [Lactuca saligna]|uniref:W2 domain-containing protein n=1 Tax=Lactuca saligna TaxID=75948 RepID=A0AA35UNH1_LACSI|nr:unnamed protein product [Lactuca saligna]
MGDIRNKKERTGVGRYILGCTRKKQFYGKAFGSDTIIANWRTIWLIEFFTSGKRSAEAFFDDFTKAGMGALVEYNDKIFECLGKNQQQNAILALRQVKTWAKLLPEIVRSLYDQDVLAEDTILHWFCKGNNPKGRSFNAGLQRDITIFINQVNFYLHTISFTQILTVSSTVNM